MNVTLNDLKNSIGLIQYVILFIYTLAVFVSLIYGLGYGLDEWRIWMDTHKPVKLTKLFAWCEPIVNTSINAGYAVWHMLTCGISTTFVAATFPVSVPIITLFFSESDENPPIPENTRTRRKIY